MHTDWQNDCVIEIGRIHGTDETWEGITVAVGGRSLDLSWRWLRDHSRDEFSFHHDAQQCPVTPRCRGSGRSARRHGR
jgi:hypothetical protein